MSERWGARSMMVPEASAFGLAVPSRRFIVKYLTLKPSVLPSLPLSRISFARMVQG